MLRVVEKMIAAAVTETRRQINTDILVLASGVEAIVLALEAAGTIAQMGQASPQLRELIDRLRELAEEEGN